MSSTAEELADGSHVGVPAGAEGVDPAPVTLDVVEDRDVVLVHGVDLLLGLGEQPDLGAVPVVENQVGGLQENLCWNGPLIPKSSGYRNHDHN